MKKSIENIPACNELNPLATDLSGKLNTSEFDSIDASTWTRGPNFVSSLYLHPNLCILVTKANASLHRLALVFVGRKCNTYPKPYVLAQI